MGNLKIVTTGILFRLFLRRKLSNLQWMAIVLLAIGTTTSQVKGCGEASSLAGVYTEFLMKKNNDSLYWQNVQLYTFGAIFNMARLLLDDFRGGFEKGPWWQRLFNGYSITTWLVVFNLGSTGLLVSWLMKYADNIVKVYSTSMAMLLTMVISAFLFNFRPTLQLFLEEQNPDVPSLIKANYTVGCQEGNFVERPKPMLSLKHLYKRSLCRYKLLLRDHSEIRAGEKTNMSEGSTESFPEPPQNAGGRGNGQLVGERGGHFQMPLHYPRYSKADYETMPEWKHDYLLAEYYWPLEMSTIRGSLPWEHSRGPFRMTMVYG
ncbi:hypothetical protein F0562_019323 [Nyssa sinensis]|uniref:DUF7722 domain-containing protein n=1 Tax=Nyssa sinensis TaxID=561372 RepID=A0A5J4ZEC3_9ASTE|nr:hypothetical protein F0562_019323 [Nyssa sinensis]